MMTDYMSTALTRNGVTPLILIISGGSQSLSLRKSQNPNEHLSTEQHRASSFIPSSSAEL